MASKDSEAAVLSRTYHNEEFPELFNQTQIDPRTRKREAEMEVLIIGMMRTGTASIKAALEQLGYQGVYHMTTVMKNPPDSRMWKEAADAKYKGKGRPYQRADWDQLLGHSQACCDVPSAAFMPELMEAYPNAKVIVSMRDPEKWYQSLEKTVKVVMHDPVVLLLAAVDTDFIRPWLMMTISLMGGVFGPKGIQDPDNAKARYVALHEEVRRLCPPERLLEFQLQDGWEPFCKFLGKDIPAGPFPFVNDGAVFLQRAQTIKRLALRRASRKLAPYAAVLGLTVTVWWYLGSRW